MGLLQLRDRPQNMSLFPLIQKPSEISRLTNQTNRFKKNPSAKNDMPKSERFSKKSYFSLFSITKELPRTFRSDLRPAIGGFSSTGVDFHLLFFFVSCLATSGRDLGLTHGSFSRSGFRLYGDGGVFGVRGRCTFLSLPSSLLETGVFPRPDLLLLSPVEYQIFSFCSVVTDMSLPRVAAHLGGRRRLVWWLQWGFAVDLARNWFSRQVLVVSLSGRSPVVWHI